MERSPTITSKLDRCQDCDTEFYYSFILRLHRALSHASASADINTLTTGGERSEDTTTPSTEFERDNRRIHENTIGKLCNIVLQISKAQWTHSNAIGTDTMNCYRGLLAIDARIKDLPDTAHILACSQDIRSELEQMLSLFSSDQRHRLYLNLMEDHKIIILQLQKMVETRSGRDAFRRLRGPYARDFLDFACRIQQDLRMQTQMPDSNFIRLLGRLVVQVSQSSNLLPRRLYLRDLQVDENDHVTSGSFGDVYRGTYEGYCVSVKKLPVHRTKVKAFQREALIWSQLHHPNILPLLGVSYALHNCPSLISPWMPNGHILHCVQQDMFSKDDLHRLVLEILEGLAYLHSDEVNIIHGDLRPPNILIDRERHARLTDFGLSNFAETNSCPLSVEGLGGVYAAPEFLDPAYPSWDDKQYASKAGDIFSFGMTCWAIYAKEHPFEGRGYAYVFEVGKGNRPRYPGPDLDDETWKILQYCWKHFRACCVWFMRNFRTKILF